MKEKRTCPCKKLPLCLSTFTAAEYGDLHTLSNKLHQVNKVDSGGYTALHLAAQNGHTAATAFLLQSGADVNHSVVCGASPLHRASFAGAVTTMKLLIDAGANLIVHDTSFGDRMTPLHKAAAGGRYLAVKLLLDSLKARSDASMEDGLAAVDSQGRTPINVAREMQQRDFLEESQSVKRWDAVAHGSPDWDQCVLLLEVAERTINPSTASLERSSSLSLPFSGRGNDCLDCEASNGRCLTASWETAFRSILISSVDESTGSRHRNSTRQKQASEIPVDKSDVVVAMEEDRRILTQPVAVVAQQSAMASSMRKSCCANCGLETIAFFRVKDSLVCRPCSKNMKRSTYLHL